MNNEPTPTPDQGGIARDRPAGTRAVTQPSTIRRLLAAAAIALAVALGWHSITALLWTIIAVYLVLAVVLAVRMRMGPAQWALARDFRRAVRQLAPDAGYVNADTGQVFIHTTSRTIGLTVDQLTVAHEDDLSEAHSQANLSGERAIAVTWQEYWTAAGSGLMLTTAQGGMVDEHPDGTLTNRPRMPQPPLQQHIGRRWQLAHRLVADEADVRAVLNALRDAHPRNTDSEA